MNTEDLTNALQDTLDTIRGLAIVSTDSPQQHALRVSVGRIITTLQAKLDEMDYAHALFICEIGPVVANHYKQIYMDAQREGVAA
jgi:hypothetical protein